MRKQCVIPVLTLLLTWAAMASSEPGKPTESKAADDTETWSAWGGSIRLELRGDYLPDFGLEIRDGDRAISSRRTLEYPIENLGSIAFNAPHGNFEGFLDGRVTVRTDLVLVHNDRKVSLRELDLVAAQREGIPALKVYDATGKHLLTVTYIHAVAEHEKGQLGLHNADVIGTKSLARLLELPVLADTPVGMAWLDLNLRVPEGADLSGIGQDRSNRGLSCTGRPFWPQEGNHMADVGLIDIGTVAYQGTQSSTGLVKVAPSAELKNLSTADIPWIPKFSSLGSYPYDPPDQHPFLVWNMYKIADGRIEQLGESGVKHAFFTVNSNCDINCGSGNVLWPGCEDVYSSGTNDSNSSQGPRADIDASEGLFLSTCSFFDPGCTGSQTNNSSSFENRLVVDPAELQTSGAEYFLDAWYVIQHDVAIWNSMGYHSLSPSPSGSAWDFDPLGPFTVGPVIEEWVSESTTDPMADHVEIVVPSETPGEPYPANQPQGHMRLVVTVSELATDRWRYNYALQNFDFDRGVTEFTIPQLTSNEVLDTFFGDIDADPGNDWTVTTGPGVVFSAGTEDNKQTWFRLYNYEVETSVPPTEGQVSLQFASGASPTAMTVNTLAPGLGEEFFADGFE